MDRGNQERKNPNPGKDFIQQCRDVFEVFDSDGKGTITQYKLSKVMKMYGWRSEHKELQKMISEVDHDNNGFVTFEEFAPLMRKIIYEDIYLEEELTQVFLNFGFDKDLLTSDPLISKIFIASNGLLSKDDIMRNMIEIQSSCDDPFDCELASKIVLRKIHSKKNKPKQKYSQTKPSRLEDSIMVDLKGNLSVSKNACNSIL